MLAENYTALDYYRYERKFTAEVQFINKAETILRLHPAAFSERYRARKVNNIYFDTPSLEFFADNHMGKDKRVKYRIRWYEELKGLVRPILEIKIKKGLVGYKKSFLLNEIEINETLTKANLINLIVSSDVPADVIEKMKLLEPVLLNTYSRRYFESFDRRFRFTFDSKMQYYHFNRSIQFGRPASDNSMFVIEMKYAKEHDDEASQVAQYIPFRLSKNSKYVNGIMHFYPGIAT
ncbi:MAG: VTC domain-containing protein [Prolixibacteraceae bacterium]|jgi:SPX domain protein involved in polyphosphate accumulation|nr:VTC domain-containing protein [Prolixibacteraceae bacterium]